MSFAKLQLFLQKSFFRLVMMAATALFIGVFLFAVQLEKYNKPPADMRMPSKAYLGKAALDAKGKGTESLTTQHLSSPEVSMMLTEMIAESLVFNSNNYGVVTTTAKKYFTDNGYAQYTQFLNNSGFQTALNEKNLQSGAYVAGNPVELGRGVYGGAYKWMYEVPVTISFIPRAAATYERRATTPENRDFILRAQLARVADPQDPDAVKIELWQVLPPRKK